MFISSLFVFAHIMCEVVNVFKQLTVKYSFVSSFALILLF